MSPRLFSFLLSLIIYLLALAGSGVLSCPLQASPGPGIEARLHPVTRQVYLMGTQCTLTTYAPSRQEGLLRLEIFLRILEETEQELSSWRQDSVLTRLNRHPVGAPFPLNPRLCRLFQALIHWWKMTGAAFDPGIGELINAWQIRGAGRRPTAGELDQARRDSGLEHLVLQEKDCQIIRRRHVSIDAGAFGKGEALDRVLEVARKKVFDRWLIDLGGQLMVRGAPPERDGWTAVLAHPGDRREAVLEIELTSGSLATSGGSERDLRVEGERLGHILNPATGRPAGFSGSVSVWHEQGLAADILSTALYVMGPEKAWVWAVENKVAACFLILPEGRPGQGSALRILTTPAFRPLLEN